MAMDTQLHWPLEASRGDYADSNSWNQAGSNICLDFHGDPVQAKLVVFSDGNHHMALQACCRYFLQQHPEVEDIFYATTPPRVILDSVLKGGVMLGNLRLNLRPDIFISPKNILDKLVEEQQLDSHKAFARSRDNVLLVKKGNPKAIQGVADLLRADVRLTISNPVTEAASYNVYKQTLMTVADEQGLDKTSLANLIARDAAKTVFGESIHHREVPQAIYQGLADVAVVYYHLALRYTRIFPDSFDLVDIQTKKPVTTDYHIGLMNNAGQWGQPFLEFMLSDTAINIYKEHGLQKL